MARARARRPDYIRVDEPATGLDLRTAASTRACLGRVRRELGATTVIVFPNMQSVFAIANLQHRIAGARGVGKVLHAVAHHETPCLSRLANRVGEVPSRLDDARTGLRRTLARLASASGEIQGLTSGLGAPQGTLVRVLRCAVRR